MSYALAQRFIEDAKSLDTDEKIRVITILLDSLRPARHEMSDEEVMELFNQFTGSMHVDKDFDIREEKNSYLDERYGV